MPKPLIWFLAVVVIGLIGVTDAHAQPLGTFAWQLQPFCNRVVINVTQNGAVYTFDGFDDQCGGSNPRAPLVGTGTVNPDGSIGFGLNIVTAPGGAALHVDATITLPSIGGTWRDSAGNTGAFVLNAAAGGVPRPLPALGDITGVTAGTGLTGGGSTGTVTLNVDPTAVQSRITAACPANQVMVSVNQNGTVNCIAASGGAGDITSVNTPAGSGLLGGSASGDVTLMVDPTVVQSRVTAACPAGQLMTSINQNGTVNCQTPAAAGGGTITGVTAGTGITGGGTTGNVTVGVNFAGPGSAATVARSDHDHTNPVTSSVAVGTGALPTASGQQNTAVGPFALNAATTANNNVAVGHSALTKATSGFNNTAVGSLSLLNATTASGNTAVGGTALVFATTGSNNTAVGNQTLQNLTTGFGNSAVGESAMQSLTTGFQNSALGQAALRATTSGSANTAMGFEALHNGTIASFSTAVGHRALRSNVSNGMTAIGFEALAANTTGSANVAVGSAALQSNTTGIGNTAVGQGALGVNTIGAANVAVGFSALSQNTGSRNTAVGTSAGAVLTSGVENTALGQIALDAATTGSGNTAIGRDALGSTTTGDNNVAVGKSALASNTIGQASTALGTESLLNAQTGANTAVGFHALATTITGVDNTALGTNALNALTGSQNTGLGDNAFTALTSGSGNTGMGYRVGQALTSGSNNLYLSNSGAASENDTTRIGSTQTKAFIAGIAGVVVANQATVLINTSTGQLGTLPSTRRVKEDIESLPLNVTAKLHALRPVQFHYTQALPDGTKPQQYGLIAEEVEAVAPELVAFDVNGDPATVQYHVLPALLLAEVQRLEKERAEMARELAELRALVQALARSR